MAFCYFPSLFLFSLLFVLFSSPLPYYPYLVVLEFRCVGECIFGKKSHIQPHQPALFAFVSESLRKNISFCQNISKISNNPSSSSNRFSSDSINSTAVVKFQDKRKSLHQLWKHKQNDVSLRLPHVSLMSIFFLSSMSLQHGDKTHSQCRDAEAFSSMTTRSTTMATDDDDRYVNETKSPPLPVG